MKSRLFMVITAWLFVIVCHGQSVVINKIYNSGIAADPQGQGDVVELLVVQDHLDMRGMSLQDFKGGTSSSTTFSEAGQLIFSNAPLWRSVRTGTLIVLRRHPASYTQDTDPLDKVLDIDLGNMGYFTYNNNQGVFNITNYDMLMLKDATGSPIHTMAFGVGSNNDTFNAVPGPKMRTSTMSPTGGYLYPMSLSGTISDYDTGNQMANGSGLPIWGTGTDANNIAFVAYVRSLGDYNYVHRDGDEEIGGNKAFSGNISIGTTDPKGYKLAVAGNMIAEEIKVKLQGNWPDYVFDKDYRLQSLPELEIFIKQKKHLPGVPSEKEVKEAGNISLGEMDRILLKKIEELTLYIIEQQKLINKLLHNQKK